MPVRTRIDVLMVERGLVESRSVAQRLIMAGQVRLNGQRVHKASDTAEAGAVIEIRAMPKYVSRGGEKLAAALSAFAINPEGQVCADVGASTGGFTDCLLQAGARKVYAVDVGKGQLHYRLRKDARVLSLEGTNVRHLEHLPETVELVTVDVSFISLTLIFPVVKTWLNTDGIAIALIKPQFEAGREQVGKGGVVKDPNVHGKVLRDVFDEARRAGFSIGGLIRSPLKGPKGNTEFLALLTQKSTSLDETQLISNALSSGSN